MDNGIELGAMQCDVCRDTGYVRYDVPIDDARFGKLFPCPACAKGTAIYNHQIKVRIESAGLPERYQRLTFETWEQTLSSEQQRGKRVAYFAALCFAESSDGRISLSEVRRMAGMDGSMESLEKRSLVFCGDFGTGKTGLVAAIINRLAEQERPALYIRTRDMIREVQRRYSRSEHAPGDGPDDMIRRFQQAPLLALDEFNIHTYSADRLEIVEDIIRYRHGRDLPTLITSNLTQHESLRTWGPWVTTVLLEMAHWIEVGPPRLRREDEIIGDETLQGEQEGSG